MIAIVLRHAFGLHNLITDRHLDILARVLLASGIAVGYCYLMEAFTAWYSGDLYGRQTLFDRVAGVYAWVYWGAVACNVVAVRSSGGLRRAAARCCCSRSAHSSLSACG
jgi:hypothetical protein